MNKPLAVFLILVFLQVGVVSADFPSANVGVSVGDCWKYHVQSSGGNLPPYPYISIKVIGIFALQVDCERSNLNADGSLANSVIDHVSLSVLATLAVEGFYLIRANTIVGDQIVTDPYLRSGGSVVQTVQRNYWGDPRQVNVVTATFAVNPESSPTTYTFYYDRLTGILCEYDWTYRTISFNQVLVELQSQTIPEFSNVIFLLLLPILTAVGLSVSKKRNKVFVV